MRTSRQEALWVLRAQCDDREALELLLKSIQAPLRRYLCGLVGRDAADDVLQDVLVLIFRKLLWLENPDVFRPWAFRIASRAAFRWLKNRRQRREEIVDEARFAELPTPEGRPDGELISQLQAVSMPPASRAVLLLHFEQDLPLADVAAILQIPLGTAKSRLAYGLTALRRQLGAKRRA